MFVLHAMPGRGSSCVRTSNGAEAGRYVFHNISLAGNINHQGISPGGHDEPNVLERRRPAEGSHVTDSILKPTVWLFFAVGGRCHSVLSRGGLGDGLCLSRL